MKLQGLHSGVRQFQKFCGHAQLIKNLQNAGMQCVTPEITVQIAVHFQQRDIDALAGQQQGQHHAAWTGSHNAAACCM